MLVLSCLIIIYLTAMGNGHSAPTYPNIKYTRLKDQDPKNTSSEYNKNVGSKNESFKNPTFKSDKEQLIKK